MSERDVSESAAFVRGLASAFVPIAALEVDHRRSFDDLLPYVFLSEVAHWMVDQLIEDDPPPAILEGIIDYIERSLQRADPELHSLIALGFVSNLPSTGERGASIRDLLGPGLAAEYELVNW